MSALAGLCFVTFVAGLLLTRRIEVMARKFGAMDVPNERSSHVSPTPRGGGASFVLITLLVAAWTAYAAESTPILIYAICSCVIAAVSFIDDIRSLSAISRLVVQLAASAAFVASVRPFQDLGYSIVIAAAGIFWIVFLTNVFNFMDGIDGIAASQGVVTFASMGAYALVSRETVLGSILLAAGCATAGFLLINWPPARVFMGDVGSAFLGFSVGSLAILGSDPGMLLVMFFATSPFLFDATSTLVRRLARRENLLRSHRSHYYQRLVIAGYSHRSVTLIYGGCAIAGGVAGLTAALGLLPIWPAVATSAFISVTLLLLVGRAEKQAVDVRR